MGVSVTLSMATSRRALTYEPWARRVGSGIRPLLDQLRLFTIGLGDVVERPPSTGYVAYCRAGGRNFVALHPRSSAVRIWLGPKRDWTGENLEDDTHHAYFTVNEHRGADFERATRLIRRSYDLALPTARNEARWTLKPGEVIKRTHLHEAFGGRRQGGIGPSDQSLNVFVFSDPARGERHGYIDGWMPDGLFHYTGEGQHGDQRMISGNRAILNYRLAGRALRLFAGAGGEVTYIDEFDLDTAEPWYEADAPETRSRSDEASPIRKVIVFRMRPKTIPPRPSTSLLAQVTAGDRVEAVPLEAVLTERMFVDPQRDSYEAERVEARLLRAFGEFLRARGHDVHRFRIVPDGERKPLFMDLFDATLNLVVEAKGTASREAVRMAIGQLADYARFVRSPARGILLPSEPRPDLKLLLAAERIEIIWPSGATYACTEPGVLSQLLSRTD